MEEKTVTSSEGNQDLMSFSSPSIPSPSTTIMTSSSEEEEDFKQVELYQHKDILRLLGEEYFTSEIKPFDGCLFKKSRQNEIPILYGRLPNYIVQRAHVQPEEIAHFRITEEALLNLNSCLVKGELSGYDLISQTPEDFWRDLPASLPSFQEGPDLRTLVSEYNSAGERGKKELSELKILYNSPNLGTIYYKEGPGVVYVDNFRVATNPDLMYTYNLRSQFLFWPNNSIYDLSSFEKNVVLGLDVFGFDESVGYRLAQFDHPPTAMFLSKSDLLTLSKENISLACPYYGHQISYLLLEACLNLVEVRDKLAARKEPDSHFGSMCETEIHYWNHWNSKLGFDTPKWVSIKDFKSSIYIEQHCGYSPEDQEVVCACPKSMFSSVKPRRCYRHKGNPDGRVWDFDAITRDPKRVPKFI